LKPGKLIIFSAPSGAGKTSIVQYLLTKDLNLSFSVSACTRSPRKGETDGKDYYFMTVNLFREKIKNNEFVEWEEVYKDHYYGTLRSEMNRIWENGQHIIFDVDVQGGLNLKKMFRDRALAVFVKPPSLEELKKRLLSRLTDQEDKIETRMRKATEEMLYEGFFDVVLVNDKLDAACAEAYRLIRIFLEHEPA
jgi:guanylate kinase